MNDIPLPSKSDKARLRRHGWRKYKAKHGRSGRSTDSEVDKLNNWLLTQDHFWESPTGSIVHWIEAIEMLPSD